MDNGTTVPPGMNFTVDRHHGILIHSLHPSFNADYVCTARVNGVEKTSRTFSINVIQSETTCLLEIRLSSVSSLKWSDICPEFDTYFWFPLALELRFPPYVFVETDEYVRIVGEELKIRCTTHNPNFNYNVTWKYTTKSVSIRYFNYLNCISSWDFTFFSVCRNQSSRSWFAPVEKIDWTYRASWPSLL